MEDTNKESLVAECELKNCPYDEVFNNTSICNDCCHKVFRVVITTRIGLVGE